MGEGETLAGVLVGSKRMQVEQTLAKSSKRSCNIETLNDEDDNRKQVRLEPQRVREVD